MTISNFRPEHLNIRLLLTDFARHIQANPLPLCMKLFTSILVFSILITFPSISQIKVTILNQTDSLEMMGVICTNQQNKILSVSDSKGNLSLSKNGSYILVHPSFYALKIDQFKNYTLVYLQPL